MNGFSFIDFIFLVLAGVFIYTRFFGTKLPKDDKNKKRPQHLREVFIADLEHNHPVPMALRPTPQPMPDLEGLTGLELIKKADPHFDEAQFLVGAQEAYHMFYDARQRGDKDLLQQLLSPKLERHFLAEAEEATTSGKPLNVHVEKINNADIVDARMKGKTTVVDVSYKAKIKTAGVVKVVQEVFTWARNIDAEDLNWELVDMKQVN